MEYSLCAKEGVILGQQI